MPTVDPVGANSAFGNEEEGEDGEEQQFGGVGGGGGPSDRCTLDAMLWQWVANIAMLLTFIFALGVA
jgi:hypothetical protein